MDKTREEGIIQQLSYEYVMRYKLNTERPREIVKRERVKEWASESERMSVQRKSRYILFKLMSVSAYYKFFLLNNFKYIFNFILKNILYHYFYFIFHFEIKKYHAVHNYEW